MKSVKKNLLEETMELLTRYAYRVRYVSHKAIEDYNATYNVIFENKPIITNAARKLGISQNEIWISEMWKPYEKYIVFHELREIYYRAEGFSRDEAHEKARLDGFSLWNNDPLWWRMINDIEEMDRKTAEKKKSKNRQEQKLQC
jgi:competence protein ComEA